MNKTIRWPAAGRQALAFYNDREYFRRLIQIALPIALQQFVMSSLSMVGVMMVGQMGETAVAAVGLANQIFFLLNLVVFGVNSGAAMFTAQLWGRQDIPNIRRVLSLALILGFSAGLVFFSIAVFAPRFTLSIYSEDPAVVAQGSQYLRIFGWSFLFYAISTSFAHVLRSTGIVKLPLAVSTTALILNTLLSYSLIFGKFGLPALGLPGAALAATVARAVECGGLLWLTYRLNLPAAVPPRDILKVDLPFANRVLKPVLPAAANELLWALGITTYNVVYARIGTDAIAAMNIALTIDNLAMVIFIGIANACAVLVGNRIGAKEEELAFTYAARSLSLGILGAVFMGGLILAGSGPILAQYKVAPIVIQYARSILTIIAFLLWLRVSNLIMFVGIFRSGGDTRFALLLDAGIIWSVGVPLAAIGAFIFHFPIQWVYLMVMGEELLKGVLSMIRFFNRKWIHNLAETV